MKPDAEVMLEAGRELAKKVERMEIDGHPLMLKPNGLDVIDLQPYQPRPLRLKQIVAIDTPESFINYLKQFASEQTTLVFVDRRTGEFRAVLDYHQNTQPSWKDHRANLALQPTLAWSEWETANGVEMSQVGFVRFLEDHIPDISQPLGAQLMEMVMDFEAHKAAQFSSSVRLQDGGVKFTFNETVQGSSTGGEIRVPSMFMLSLAPFEGMPLRDVVARLRFRIREGQLAIWFDLARLADVKQQAVDEVFAVLRTALTGHVREWIVGEETK